MAVVQITCNCGKKLFFGDDPNEVQVCDRCGQTISTSGPVEGKRPRARRSSDLHGDDEPPPPRRPKGRPPISTREKLYIASARGSKKGLGCLIVLLVAFAAAFAVDYFMVYPRSELRCGHEGKESYLFGALPMGHSCEGLEAIRYMDRARKAFLNDGTMPLEMQAIQSRSGIDGPPEGTPYVFEVYEGGAFTAVPESGSGLARYTMEPDGSVTREGGE